MPAAIAVQTLPPYTKVVVYARCRRSSMDVGPGGRAFVTTMRVGDLARIVDEYPEAGDLTVRY